MIGKPTPHFILPLEQILEQFIVRNYGSSLVVVKVTHRVARTGEPFVEELDVAMVLRFMSATPPWNTTRYSATVRNPPPIGSDYRSSSEALLAACVRLFGEEEGTAAHAAWMLTMGDLTL